MLSYSTILTTENQDDFRSLFRILEYERLAFNEASKTHFGSRINSIVVLHGKFYRKFRETHPEVTSQVVIKAEQDCLAAYRTIKFNKRKSKKPIEKTRLSLRLDKRLYSFDKNNRNSIRITTADGRKTFRLINYPKLNNLLEKYPFRDPLIYENDGKIHIAFVFDTKPEKLKQKCALGVDLGIRISAACSDGRIIIDRKFNDEKRKLRYLKRKLQSKGTKSSFKHRKKLRRKEANKNRNQTHLVANEILRTGADTIALENLEGIKAKKHIRQNKNRISQVPLYELRRVITYKAENAGKSVVLVNPAYTSQTDSITGKREGLRKGRRFYATNGLVYDADLNAARNIGQRSKLPVSYGNVLDGQAVVIRPNGRNTNVCKSSTKVDVLQAPEFIPG